MVFKTSCNLIVTSYDGYMVDKLTFIIYFLYNQICTNSIYSDVRKKKYAIKIIKDLL